MAGVRPWRLAWLACVVPLLASAQGLPAGPRGQVVDRVVALVDGALVSQLDLEFEAAVLLVQRGAIAAATEPLDEQVLGRVLELAINQRLLTRDADKLQAFPVDEAELEARLREFEGRFDNRQAVERFLARFEATRSMLGDVIRRSLRAEKILDNKVRLRAQVGEDEVRRYYDEHAAQLGPSYEAVRTRVRNQLTSERYTRLVAAEVAGLRRKADVRVIASFAGRKEGS